MKKPLHQRRLSSLCPILGLLCGALTVPASSQPAMYVESTCGPFVTSCEVMCPAGLVPASGGFDISGTVGSRPPVTESAPPQGGPSGWRVETDATADFIRTVALCVSETTEVQESTCGPFVSSCESTCPVGKVPIGGGFDISGTVGSRPPVSENARPQGDPNDWRVETDATADFIRAVAICVVAFPIFADGFESGDLSAWSSVVGVP